MDKEINEFIEFSEVSDIEFLIDILLGVSYQNKKYNLGNMSNELQKIKGKIINLIKEDLKDKNWCQIKCYFNNKSKNFNKRESMEIRREISKYLYHVNKNNKDYLQFTEYFP